jgi:Thioredoxin like C-terminal domain/AhpC/TSA family
MNRLTGFFAAGAAPLSVEGELPPLDGAIEWLNSPPLTPEGLRGKVVVADFCTYTCINWLRQLPYVRAWAERYKDHGLVTIGAHTPEFSFERDVDNVRKAIQEMRIDYPIAIDSDYAIWQAFDNAYWPALYFADAEGQIRHHHFGEGAYEESEMVIQRLLAEAGQTDVVHDLVSVEGAGIEAAADWGSLKSPENYVGYERTEGFSSPGGATLNESRIYSAPDDLSLDRWGLSGEWTVGREASRVNEPDGSLVYRFRARDLNLVMGPASRGESVRFRVLLDGEPPGTAHGGDVDQEGNGTLDYQRLYQLIRQPGPIADRTFEIAFPEAGAEAYCFTFG